MRRNTQHPNFDVGSTNRKWRYMGVIVIAAAALTPLDSAKASEHRRDRDRCQVLECSSDTGRVKRLIVTYDRGELKLESERCKDDNVRWKDIVIEEEEGRRSTRIEARGRVRAESRRGREVRGSIQECKKESRQDYECEVELSTDRRDLVCTCNVSWRIFQGEFAVSSCTRHN